MVGRGSKWTNSFASESALSFPGMRMRDGIHRNCIVALSAEVRLVGCAIDLASGQTFSKWMSCCKAPRGSVKMAIFDECRKLLSSHGIFKFREGEIVVYVDFGVGKNWGNFAAQLSLRRVYRS